MNPALLIWLLTSGGLVVAVSIARREQHQSMLSVEEIVVLVLEVAGIIVFAQIFYKACTSPEWQKILEWDGTIALCIGSGFGMYLAIKEIYKLFLKKP